MAISGLHISCVKAGSASSKGPIGTLPVYSENPLWSESISSPGTSASQATTHDSIFRIFATSDSYVAVGNPTGTPSATNGYFIPAYTVIDVAVYKGSYVSWALA